MNCDHSKVEFIATPELTHHGKEVCLLCRRFVRWVAKPETQARIQRNAEILVRLRNDGRMDKWQRGFIASIEGQGPKLSPNQQAKLDEIAALYV